MLFWFWQWLKYRQLVIFLSLISVMKKIWSKNQCFFRISVNMASFWRVLWIFHSSGQKFRRGRYIVTIGIPWEVWFPVLKKIKKSCSPVPHFFKSINPLLAISSNLDFLFFSLKSCSQVVLAPYNLVFILGSCSY